MFWKVLISIAVLYFAIVSALATRNLLKIAAELAALRDESDGGDD